MAVQFLSQTEATELRRQNYNATVTHIRQVHEDLWLFRIRPDEPIVGFEAGQYVTLGLGNWEPRVPGAQLESLTEPYYRKLVRRAYSISCPVLGEADQLIRASQSRELEFYITLVREAEKEPPGLTPRLFALQVGDRLQVGKKVVGTYTLAPVSADDNVVFIGTGTGEAPHNAMLAELLARNHTGQIASVICVRERRDLAYETMHRRLEELYPPYKYLAITTREPENLDPQHPGYVGKVYVQSYFESGRFEAETGLELDPAKTHVYLCGNPAMIGIPLPATKGGRDATAEAHPVFPTPKGMIEVLVQRGFQIDAPRTPGNIHFEKYW